MYQIEKKFVQSEKKAKLDLTSTPSFPSAFHQILRPKILTKWELCHHFHLPPNLSLL